MDCVYGALRHHFEVGETSDQAVAYFKAKRPIKVMIEELECYLGRFGLVFEVLKTKEDRNGNVIKVQLFNTGTWNN